MDCGRTLDAVRKWLPWGAVGHRGCPFRRVGPAQSWRCDPQDQERTQAEANPETKRCYQEVFSCSFTR